MQVEGNITPTILIQEEDNHMHTIAKINLPLDLVRKLQDEYLTRCLVGLMFGLALPLEILKRWTKNAWCLLREEVEVVQVFLKDITFSFLRRKTRLLKSWGKIVDV